ncbi:Fic family protein [Tannerella sp.]|uniref:Fic family protein n=1 Tax=Tannerella sp. TaxID=2382127 RepID=UPI0026DAE71B|nr:DUF4172 domain-containing protein [Tannerella sp.]MDO4704294.1 DUF4172 domain-containing protein [Tannerella sp.]
MRKTAIWQEKGWPYLTWNYQEVMSILGEVRNRQGRLVGKTSLLGIDLKKNALLNSISNEIIRSAELDGQILDAQKVRSSVSRQLKLEKRQNPDDDIDMAVDGIVRVSTDALLNYLQPITEERLYGWKDELSPETSCHTDVLTPTITPGVLPPFAMQDMSPISREMKRFIRWINTTHTTDPVIKAGVAHVYFWLLHPFATANGQIARTIMHLFLARADNSRQRFFCLSEQFCKRKETYHQLMQTVCSRDMDVTEWLMWFLHCLETALTEAEASITRILEKSKFWEKYRLVRLNDRQVKMINLLWEGMDDKLTSSIWANINLCSPDTALRDIQDLIDKKILHKHGDGGRSTSYGLKN